MAGIFVSYKRGVSNPWAMFLHARLAQAFGSDEAFVDVGTIAPGEAWADVIDRYLDRSDIFVCLIAPDFLDPPRPGHGDITNQDNPFRHEIRSAFALGIHVVPLLVEGARMPTEAKLPADIRSLHAIHAFDLNAYRDVDDIIDHIKDWRARQIESTTTHACRLRISIPPTEQPAGIPPDSIVDLDSTAALILGLDPGSPPDNRVTWGDVVAAGRRTLDTEWLDQIARLADALRNGQDRDLPPLNHPIRSNAGDGFYLPTLEETSTTRRGERCVVVSLRPLPPEAVPLPGASLAVKLAVDPKRKLPEKMAWIATVQNDGEHTLRRVTVRLGDKRISGTHFDLAPATRRRLRFTTPALHGGDATVPVIATGVDERGGTVTATAVPAPPDDLETQRKLTSWRRGAAWLGTLVAASVWGAYRIDWQQRIADGEVSTQTEAYAYAYGGLAAAIILLAFLWYSYTSATRPDEAESHAWLALLVGFVGAGASVAAGFLDRALGWPWPVGVSIVTALTVVVWFLGASLIVEDESEGAETVQHA